LVRVLDMSMLVHNGSRSLTARILGRLKGSLEYFVAPQASFASVPSVSFVLGFLADMPIVSTVLLRYRDVTTLFTSTSLSFRSH